MKKYIILPTYNEAETIEKLVKEIFTLHPDFYAVIVDDNSPDGTGNIADRLRAEYKNLDVIHRTNKSGLGKAYIEGFKKALSEGADLIFEMDADYSHNPVYLTDFLEAIKHSDLVIGSRYINGVRVDGWRFRRLLLSKLANIFVSFVMVKPVWDFTAGFRCYKKEVLESINLDSIVSDGYAFQIEMTYNVFKNGFRVNEIPILFVEREHGYSKISRNIVKEAFWITLRCRASVNEIFKHLIYIYKDYNKFVDNYKYE